MPGDLPSRVNGGYFLLRQGSSTTSTRAGLVMDIWVRAARDRRTRTVPSWALWRDQLSPGGAPIIPVDVPSIA